MMLDGGVGCVRLGSKQLPDGHVWFMGAASEPVAHQGIPVALPDALYRRHIGQVATNGAVRCTITGELRYLPDDLNHPYRALRGIPQVYIIAKEVRQPNPLRAQEFIADGAVLIQTGQAGTPPDNPFSPTPGIFAAYVTFRPGRPDAVNEAAQWLADDYVGELLNGRVITDFDEQVRRFGDAIFSLEHIMSGRVPIADAERLIGDLAKPREAAELVQLIMNGNVHVTTIIGSHNAVASESSAAAAGSAAANYFHGTTNSIVQSRGQQERRMPDVILIEIAAALAAKTAESLYEFVRNKFRARKKALDVLDAASGAAPDSPQVIALAEELATAEDYDQQFGEQLRAQWAAIQGQAYDGGVVNTISGTVRGDAVQARDIHGGITFGSAQTAPPSPDPKSLRKRLSTAGDANGSPWIRQDVPADGVHDLVYSALLAAPRATGLLAPLRRPSSCRMYTATSSFNRSKILTDIHDSQCTGDRQVAVQIFHGMDDIGKTELALECAYKYEADYDVAWWVKAGGASELAPGLCLARPEAGLLRANRRTRCRRAHERPCAPVAGGC
jgi:hypothetical protein